MAGVPTDIPRRAYRCKGCQRVHARWVPRCLGCHGWSLEAIDDHYPFVVQPKVADTVAPVLETEREPTPLPDAPNVPASTRPRSKRATEPEGDDDEDLGEVPVALSDIEQKSYVRDSTNIPQLDLVLGGGLVVGTVLVLGGEPGSAKSTLTNQAADGLAIRVLYASGEESVEQVAARAHRIDAASHRVFIVAETDLDRVLKHARAVRAELIVVDSIQTMSCADLGGMPGSPGQVRECTNRLMRFAKTTGVSVWLIGHVTNDGAMAGPRTLKHLVDVVLEIEVGTGNRRILRTSKNRFGMTADKSGPIVGRFEITAQGMIGVENASDWDDPVDYDAEADR